MSQEALQHIIGMAIIDTEFRRLLLHHREQAIADLDLTAEEREAILAIQADSLEELSQRLHAWIVERERKVSKGCWTRRYLSGRRLDSNHELW
ncbi:MAG: Os1348 family NHLP clan protein [Anaerolineae bacterium]